MALKQYKFCDDTPKSILKKLIDKDASIGVKGSYMKHINHIIVYSMLVLSMLVLPMQNVWSMANMSPCDMDMSSHDMSNMDMSGCSTSMGDLSSTDIVADIDCGDNHCNKCFHSSSFILTPSAVLKKNINRYFFAVFESNYLTLLIVINLSFK